MGATCVTCKKKYASMNSLKNSHYKRHPSHTPDHWDECHECGRRFDSLGQHWSMGNCNPPDLSQYQKEVVTGVLMGDGCVTMETGGINPLLRVGMVTQPYLNHLYDVFGELAPSGPTIRATAEECARLNRETGFAPNAQADNYQDQYLLYTRSLPALKPYYDWYASGKKVFPDNIQLTPTVLKHWHACDGSYSGTITIGCLNEIENKDKLKSYFTREGLPEPRFYKNSGSIAFTQSETDELFDYMGDPLPGFDYKWP